MAENYWPHDGRKLTAHCELAPFVGEPPLTQDGESEADECCAMQPGEMFKLDHIPSQMG